MRTTLDIDDDVLLPVRSLARQRGISMGSVLSELVRYALTQAPPSTIRSGVPLFQCGRVLSSSR